MTDIKKIEQILADHENRILKLEGTKTKPIKTDIDSTRPLRNLLKGSFFNQPKKYGEIIKQLKINAVFSLQDNYKNGLATLVREEKLIRKMVHHQWVYFKNG